VTQTAQLCALFLCRNRMLKDIASVSNVQAMMQETSISAEQNDNDISGCNSCSSLRDF
jgi:hypothetical protein